MKEHTVSLYKIRNDLATAAVPTNIWFHKATFLRLEDPVGSLLSANQDSGSMTPGLVSVNSEAVDHIFFNF